MQSRFCRFAIRLPIQSNHQPTLVFALRHSENSWLIYAKRSRVRFLLLIGTSNAQIDGIFWMSNQSKTHRNRTEIELLSLSLPRHPSVPFPLFGSSHIELRSAQNHCIHTDSPICVCISAFHSSNVWLPLAISYCDLNHAQNEFPTYVRRAQAPVQQWIAIQLHRNDDKNRILYATIPNRPIRPLWTSAHSEAKRKGGSPSRNRSLLSPSTFNNYQNLCDQTMKIKTERTNKFIGMAFSYKNRKKKQFFVSVFASADVDRRHPSVETGQSD